MQQNFATLCKGTQNNANEFKTIQEYTKVCNSMPKQAKYARLHQSRKKDKYKKL